MYILIKLVLIWCTVVLLFFDVHCQETHEIKTNASTIYINASTHENFTTHVGLSTKRM